MTNIVGHDKHQLVEDFDENKDIIRVYNKDVYPPFLYDNSKKRTKQLISSLKKIPTNTNCLKIIAGVLDVGLVLRGNTCQQMVFNPRTGKYKVWKVTS